MVERSKRSKIIHLNKLNPSPHEALKMGADVERIYISLANDYRRTKNEDFVPPQELNEDMLRWRTMVVRHNNGDYRCTEAELLAMEAVAEWLYNEKCALCGQEPKKIGL
ncbi:hypothetical protein KAR91_77395 [Candidatus Pacearchaeota archaeon]|nr:hypothetical protein [Candidatus Pacearchaeota archaeon]